MKTAIEQMMEDLHDTFPRFFNVHSAEGRVFMGIATKYLAVEKEQIQDACWAGGNDGKQYYNETYGGGEQ
jgi:hypothetical protein